MLNFDRIYILHHKPLKHRKKYIEEKIKDFGWQNIKWVEHFLPDELENNTEKLSDAQLSSVLKHKFAVEDAKENGYENILVLEDDIDFDTNLDVTEFLINVLEESVKHNYQICWPGGVMMWNFLKTHRNELVSTNKVYTSRCAHAYMVHSSIFDIILDNWHTEWPADFMYNEIIEKNKLRSYWTNPFLEQRTCNGKEKTSVPGK